MTKDEFKKLFDMHFDPIRSYIYYRSADKELATDIAQDTFMRVWEKKLKPEKGKEKALLYKIASDMFISRYRKNQSAQKYQQSLTLDFKSDSPEDQMQYKELKNTYETALTEMPDKQRTVFLMSRMEELKYAEIATALNISVKAVEKRMGLALKFLRGRLQPTGNG